MNPTNHQQDSGLWRVLPILMATLLLGCQSESAPQTGAAKPPPPSVTVQTVQPRTVQIRGEYPGRVRGRREVEVRARVEGILLERSYIEGEVVKKGEPLWRIDPAPFKVALRRAEAELARRHAKLRQAKREWTRVSDLFEQNAVSAREHDQALSALELAKADVAVAEAQVAQARIDLGYTEVNAPLTGATSLEARPVGSLVGPGDLLTTITELDPVYVLFSIPEHDATLRREAMRAMTAEKDSGTREARVILPNGDIYPQTGIVNFTNSTIDPETGTVQARAVFQNQEGGLIPGQFVRVSVRTRTLDHAIVVPEQAVTAVPGGPIVYVVDNKNVVHARPVQLGARLTGGQIIRDGLEGGERIVVRGMVQLSDGVAVNPEKGKTKQADQNIKDSAA